MKLTSKERELDRRGIRLTKTHRRLDADTILFLQDAEESRFFRKMGYRSLYKYATKRLKFDGKNFYPYITVSKKAKSIPALQSAIVNSKITIAAASRITSILTNDNADEWIEFSISHTFEETERELATKNPKRKKPDKIKFISEDQVEVRFTFHVKAIENARRYQSLEAQKKNNFEISKCFELAMERDLERRDPVKQAERYEKRKAKRAELKPAKGRKDHKPGDHNRKSRKESKTDIESFGLHRNSEDNLTPNPAAYEIWDFEKANRVQPNNEAVPAGTKRKLDLRDQGKCTQVDENGVRCNSDRWTDTHHIISRAQGGSNALENLTTLCGFHHDMVHQLSLPIEGGFNLLRSPQRAYSCD